MTVTTLPIDPHPRTSRRRVIANVFPPALRAPESAAAAVFAAVRHRGPVARDVVASVSGLSIATVNRQVSALLDARLERLQSHPGRRLRSVCGGGGADVNLGLHRCPAGRPARGVE